ncbi:hypothetical protein EYF80_059167 [Liparis tanakae]|uniref:Uncharacterized protein n=1 Tax=Liparis tanakae TaxID=230148 RepID=A0A4Z2EQ42_9TELE|nr:hypothetical protein EYF80_059167 [Liparis tanakae]
MASAAAAVAPPPAPASFTSWMPLSSSSSHISNTEAGSIPFSIIVGLPSSRKLVSMAGPLPTGLLSTFTTTTTTTTTTHATLTFLSFRPQSIRLSSSVSPSLNLPLSASSFSPPSSSSGAPHPPFRHFFSLRGNRTTEPMRTNENQ